MGRESGGEEIEGEGRVEEQGKEGMEKKVGAKTKGMSKQDTYLGERR